MVRIVQLRGSQYLGKMYRIGKMCYDMGWRPVVYEVFYLYEDRNGVEVWDYEDSLNRLMGSQKWLRVTLKDEWLL